jgi:probable O-glycosylation ligase (exosortase A-associated)
MALSVAYYGIKGGIFTVLVGGEFQVWGPPGSFIEDNNHLATATVMTIPLLRYLQVQTKKRWLRWVLMGSMVSCFFSVLGSHSRGAFLACAAMLAFLWMKGRHKAITAIVLITLVPVAIGFMPDKWEDRMKSIQNYEEDASASSRLGTWRTALALANDRPITGAGFEAWNEYVFSLYAPPGVSVHSAHSIYFQILGEHGYVGLVLFLLMWFLVWREASRIAKLTENWPEFHWAYDLSRMIQTALVGYAVGGAFLNLAYYDVPYNILAVVVLTKVLVDKAIKERPGAIAPGWAATPAYGRPPPRPDTPAPHALPPLNRRA